MAVQSFAQAITVNGIVKDKTGEAVIGANVVVKGTTNGCITDFDGNFSLEANQGDILVRLPVTGTSCKYEYANCFKGRC